MATDTVTIFRNNILHNIIMFVIFYMREKLYSRMEAQFDIAKTEKRLEIRKSTLFIE